MPKETRMSLQAKVPLTLLLLSVIPGANAQIKFTDVTAESGLGTQSGFTQSVAWGDYDDDGDPDLYLTNRGSNRLLRNMGNGEFEDVTAEAGVAGPLTLDGDGIGVAFGDFDNDGDLDLYVSQINDGTDQLYRNEGPTGANGQFIFTDVASSAGVIAERTARGLALIDYDRDGLLDIYATASGANLLFHNEGNLTFVETAASLGVDAPGRDVGVVATDINNDGWSDLFVANRTFDPTNLYRNDEGDFIDIAADAGITVEGLGMGVIAMDYDNDLDMDLYWTVWPGEGQFAQPNVLYENLGNEEFADVTRASDTEDALGWGISANSADIDNDGWMDFFVANGFDPTTTPSVLYHNQGDGSFDNITNVLSSIPKDARGVAFADYDGDGDQDILVTAFNAPTRLWRNDSDNSNHWLQLNLKGSVSNHSAVGARVEVQTSLQTTVQEVYAGTGRGNQNAAPLHFGLGSADSVMQVRIWWPSGQMQILEGLSVDQKLTVNEPGPQPLRFAGLWYGGPQQDGHGLNLSALDSNRYLIFWNVFDNAGNHYWLHAIGKRQGNRIVADAYTTEGGAFPPAHDVAKTRRVSWGQLELDFSDCDKGVLIWSPVISGFQEGSMDIQRVTQPLGLECG